MRSSSRVNAVDDDSMVGERKARGIGGKARHDTRGIHPRTSQQSLAAEPLRIVDVVDAIWAKRAVYYR